MRAGVEEGQEQGPRLGGGDARVGTGSRSVAGASTPASEPGANQGYGGDD